MTDISERTLGDLVTANPSRARILERHGLDYCCGGRRTLKEACAAAGLDEQAVQAGSWRVRGRSGGLGGAGSTRAGATHRRHAPPLPPRGATAPGRAGREGPHCARTPTSRARRRTEVGCRRPGGIGAAPDEGGAGPVSCDRRACSRAARVRVRVRRESDPHDPRASGKFATSVKRYRLARQRPTAPRDSAPIRLCPNTSLHRPRAQDVRS
jgi:hypothetical protein